MWLFATGLEMTKGEAVQDGTGATEETESTDVGDDDGMRSERSRKESRVRHGVSMERRREVLAGRGKMSLGELLRCRVRYFSDGAVIGSREFVASQVERDEGATGEKARRKRRRGVCIAGAAESGLCSLRDLRVEPVTRH